MKKLCRNLAASDTPQMSRQTRQGPHDNSAFHHKGKKIRTFKMPRVFFLAGGLLDFTT